MKSLLFAIGFVIFFAVDACCGDHIVIYGDGSGNTGDGNAINNSTINNRSHNRVTGYQKHVKTEQHSVFWCSKYEQAVKYARKGYFREAAIVCNKVIKEGDSIHSNNCAALKEIFNIR
jgi:hypothetical protein